MPFTPLPPDTQAHRLEELRRAFKRQLRCRLTVVEKQTMLRAVRLVFRAEQAALDPEVTANDLVRLDNAANRARLAWLRVVAVHAKSDAAPQPLFPSLGELLERTRRTEKAVV